MNFKVEMIIKDDNNQYNIIFDDVYNIITYIECITFFRRSTGDFEYNYKYENIVDLKITKM